MTRVFTGPHPYLHRRDHLTDLVVGGVTLSAGHVRVADEGFLLQLGGQPGGAVGKTGERLEDGATRLSDDTVLDLL